MEGITFPSEKDDWKIFEKSNLKIAGNVLHAIKEKIYSAYISKHYSNSEKQIIPLMILLMYHLGAKKLPALLRRITSTRNNVYQCDFYYLNCVHSFANESRYESHQKVYENLDFNHYQKSHKAPFM